MGHLWETRRNMKGYIGDARQRTSFGIEFGRTSTLESSDLRDKVFGILGFTILSFQDRVPYLLTIDYNKSVREVFRDATRYTILQYRCLWILRYVSYAESGELNTDWPSWVPRMKIGAGDHKTSALMSHGYRSPSGFQIVHDPWLGFDPEGDPNLLVVPGRGIARIYKVYPIFVEDPSNAFWVMILKLVKTKEEYKIRVARLLTMNRDFRHKEWHQDTLLDLFERWVAHFRAGSGPLKGIASIDEDTEEPSRSLIEFNQAITNAVKYRRFAITNKDLMALVPKVCVEGDIIALMEAADVPYAVRLDTDRIEFLLLGECYIEDNMAGEAFKAADGTSLDSTVSFRFR